MKILVCIKEVPALEQMPELDRASHWLAELEPGAYRMNRSDEHALEEALLIAQHSADARIDALTVGPARSANTLRRALGKGAHAGVHILDESPGYRSPQRTAALIAAYAAPRGYDLVLTGVMAEDDLQGLVGPLLAARLELPCTVAVTRLRLNRQARTLEVACDIEGGQRMHASLTLPALLAVQTGINQPRYPSLSNMLRARRQPLTTIAANELAHMTELEKLCAIDLPPRERKGQMLSGTASDKAERLLEILYGRSLLACRPDAPAPLRESAGMQHGHGGDA